MSLRKVLVFNVNIYIKNDRILATDDFKEFDFEQLARDVLNMTLKQSI